MEVVRATLYLVACLALCAGCDSQSQNPQVNVGWVTNCVGPEFSKFAQKGHAGPGPERPVFKINDQLVLAVPKEYSPHSISIDHEPRTCTKVSDLPTVPFVYFYFQGNWSGAVTVRIERKEALEESQEIQESRRKALQEQAKEMYQLSGLTCLQDYCSGERPGDSDVLRLKYQPLNDSLVAIYAGYASHKYGGSSVWWQTVTSDLSRWREIDDEVWKFVDDWNLLSTADASPTAAQDVVKSVAVPQIPPDAEAAAPDGSAIPLAGFPRRYAFHLTSGHGAPVCEAFLQRLNQATFSYLPYCGLPDHTAVPGFSALKRRALSRGEFEQLYDDAMNLIENRPPVQDYIQQKEPDGTVEWVRPPPKIPESFVPKAWSYDSPIDIDNNGRPERVVIWSDEDRRYPNCGMEAGPQAVVGRGLAAGIIVKPDGTLDRTRSIAVFGRESSQDARSYVPLSMNLSLFRYRDRTYIAAWLEKKPLSSKQQADTEESIYKLGMFTRDNGQTNHLCDYSVRVQELE